MTASFRRFSIATAFATSALTAIAFALAITTPPRSGPFATGDVIEYPYTDAAAFVPRDYWWMYPGLLVALLFIVRAACVHRHADGEGRSWSLIALSFAIAGSTLIVVDYFVQLAVVQPSLLKGETDALSLWSQYNAHGLFIALEDLGYLLMGVAFAFMAPVFAGRDRLERVLRWLLGAAAALSVGLLVAVAAIYRSDLEYRYEVAVISVVWLTLIAGGVLIALVFRRDAAQPTG
jgi:hypothetical protein